MRRGVSGKKRGRGGRGKREGGGVGGKEGEGVSKVIIKLLS